MDVCKGEDFSIPGAVYETLTVSYKLCSVCGNAEKVDFALKTVNE